MGRPGEARRRTAYSGQNCSGRVPSPSLTLRRHGATIRKAAKAGRSNMKCGSCGSENFPEGRFCEQCGAPLEAHCPECGAGVRLTARYCGSCGCRLAPAEVARSSAMASAGAPKPTRTSNGGAAPSLHTPSRLAEKILAGRSAIEGERRQVTVLFGDIAGFTAMAENRSGRRSTGSSSGSG